jgi:NAD(P)-dependent dehydrogenase (short-subunit alcohol dehydrogenase family)
VAEDSTRRAVLVGNSDGIGLALTSELLTRGWRVHGLSRSPSPVSAAAYTHVVADVRAPEFAAALSGLTASRVDLCIYCAGVGDGFDARHLDRDTATLEINLVGLARTVQLLLPSMLARPPATLVGLSSMADALPGRGAPAYAASKAGMSFYLEGLAGAVRVSGVRVVNVRLGFVDTKMAQAPVRPFLLAREAAARRILKAVLAPRPRARVNIPRRAAAAMAVLALANAGARLLRLRLPY